MGMKKIYTCNICGEEIDLPSESFGVHFGDGKNFTLGDHHCTDGVHICYGCARQLREELNIHREVMLTSLYAKMEKDS